jgi:hypothetical protein
MKTNQRWNLAMAVGAVCVSSCLSASGTVIYDNSKNDLGIQFDPGTLEVGDEIILAGTARMLQMFSFEYWGTASGASFAGNVKAEVKFYLNDGLPFNGYSTPKTVFYDSGLFNVPSPTSRNIFVFTAGSQFASAGLFIPASDITFSVQFSGLGAGDNLGLDLYSPPVVGQNYPDFWENTPTGWELMQYPNGEPPVNFAAIFDAVPETTGFETIAITALALVGFSTFLKRKGLCAA